MIDTTIKNTIWLFNDLYRDGTHSLIKFRKARKIISDFILSKIHGTTVDNDYTSISYLGKSILDLISVTNIMIQKRKESQEEMIKTLNSLIQSLKTKQNAVSNKFESIIKEMKSFKEKTKNKVKIIFEEDTISIFFDPEQFEQYKEKIKNAFDLSEIMFSEPKKIESIGMFSVKCKNSENIKTQIVDMMKDILDSEYFDDTIVSENEILINFSN